MNPIYVARPIVPNQQEFQEILSTAFNSRHLTNGAALVTALELRLGQMLSSPNISLVCNGTVAIEVAARALRFTGKVITTPFTFPATLNALLWIGLEPVLVDVEDEYLTIDPLMVERALTDDVSGIVGVHVYGNPCDLNRLELIARARNLPILYDGAHVFDGTYQGVPIVKSGDATTLSFHATKFFNTAEGGAIVSKSSAVRDSVNSLRNFGIKSEDNIIAAGINGKMSELSAAFGLANLNQLSEERDRRIAVIDTYNEILSRHSGIQIVPTRPGTSRRIQYYAIRIGSDGLKSVRDDVYEKLRQQGIFARRYFWPLLSDVDSLRSKLREQSFDFPIASRAAKEVLVLPLHGGISNDDASRIGNAVIEALND